ncbi:hypothetical protein SPAN111604_03610 [Sphingomonas antarctica]|uniref:hypothetical protein n=1 Tax=Sphingomonas antarctica TaxID=2040274 RepID=UPI0039EC95FD
MGDPDFDRLSDYQRDCLRRTFRHQTSKEIARDLGKSKYAIDQAIERAVRTLGVTSRIDAARALAAHESTSDRITGDPVHLAATPLPAATLPVAADHVGGPVAEAAVDLRGQPSVNRSTPFRLPLRRHGEDGNDLSIGTRLVWLIILPLAMAIAFGMLANGLKLVSDVVSAIVSPK